VTELSNFEMVELLATELNLVLLQSHLQRLIVLDFSARAWCLRASVHWIRSKVVGAIRDEVVNAQVVNSKSFPLVWSEFGLCR
jgi:hypothetical protein